jgi:hypothetical protein
MVGKCKAEETTFTRMQLVFYCDYIRFNRVDYSGDVLRINQDLFWISKSSYKLIPRHTDFQTILDRIWDTVIF